MKRLALLLALIMLLSGCSQAAAPQQGADMPQSTTPANTAAYSSVKTNYSAFNASKDKAAAYLAARLNEDADVLYVYDDFSLSANHFTQKAKLDGGKPELVRDMNENWQLSPYSGDSAIQCSVRVQKDSWGGWMFLNGYLDEGETTPSLSFGERGDAGFDLTGAKALTFRAKGSKGGETVEFFTCGLGYDGETGKKLAQYPDSSAKLKRSVTLTDQWQQYSIDLAKSDLSYVSCGFGFVVNGSGNLPATATDMQKQVTFYIDEIRFEGDIAYNSGAPRFIRSYETDTRQNKDTLYIQNCAFSYDNALAAMAFVSENMQQEAKQILDSFLYAIQNDRYSHDRVRNAYAYGDIRPFPGWRGGTRLAGWYSADGKTYCEDQYQVGVNVGNTSYVALAMLQYYKQYGGEEYLACAQRLMDWVLIDCGNNAPGFTAGYNGWQEAVAEGDSVYPLTYKSIEHNIDAYAAFKQLFALTGEYKYETGYKTALSFIKQMYNADGGYFYTGTLDDANTRNTSHTALDAQAWSALALIGDYDEYEKALDKLISMRTAKNGFPFYESSSDEFWLEGTAFTALALREYGHDDYARAALNAMKALQKENGAFPAASAPSISTGIALFTGAPWTYLDICHIAPAAWYILAVNDFNPYQF